MGAPAHGPINGALLSGNTFGVIYRAVLFINVFIV